MMLRQRDNALLLCMVGVWCFAAASCQPVADEPDPLTDDTILAVVTAGPSFFFFPPLQAWPTYSGTFDSHLLDLLSVEIVRVDPVTGAQLTSVRTMTSVSSPAINIALPVEGYYVPWDIYLEPLDESFAYSIIVRAGPQVLGTATLPPQVFPIMRVKPHYRMWIRFRVEHAAVDSDNDGVYDWLDNCPTTANSDQLDTDGDHKGDACECLGVVCPGAVDECHKPGTCQSTTGACSNPVANDGTWCTVASEPGACLAGLCAAAAGTSSNPGLSCLDIFNRHGARGDGLYYVDPDGPGGGAAFQAYCDMTTSGGGWTLVSQAIPVTSTALSLCTAGQVGTLDLNDTTVNNPAKMSDAQINLLWSGNHQVLTKIDYGSIAATRSSWTRSCFIDFKSSFSWNSTWRSPVTLGDLDTRTVTCAVGSFGDNQIDGVYGGTGPFCGFRFYDGTGPSDSQITGVAMYTTLTTYKGGGCPSASSGRSWLGPLNWGCSTTKHFVR